LTVNPYIAVDALTLHRGGRDLFEHLSFEVSAGELWQVEGENGAGKTSLLRILCGLSRFGYEGRVSRDCTPLYLGHKAAVKGSLSPRENLQMHVSGRLAASGDVIDHALSCVGLAGYENTLCHQLSAGQHRRVNLARLFMDDSPLWLLDEPFTAIDKSGVQALEGCIDEHTAAGGAVVVVSHQPVATQTRVRTLVLGKGRAS